MRAAIAFVLLALAAGCAGKRTAELTGPLTDIVTAPATTPTPSVPQTPMKVLWKYNMRHLEILSYAPIESAAPLVEGDRVYAASARGAAIHAIEMATGNPIWSYRTRGRVEATPAIGGGRIYIADAKGRIHGIEKSNGKPIWRVEIAGLPTGSVLYDPDGVERVVVATNDNRVHARNAVNGAELWTYRRDPPADLSIYGMSSPARVSLPSGEGLYVIGFSDGALVALRPANGTIVWETKLVASGRFRDVDGTVFQSGDRLYVTTYGNELATLDAATGRVLWTSPPGGATGVVMGGGRLYHGLDTGEVIARDPVDGRELWRWAMPAGVPTTPVLAGDFVLVASSSRSLYAIRADSGTLAWEYDPGWSVSGSWAAPAVAGSLVFFTSNVGTVYAFEPAGDSIHYIGSWNSGQRDDRGGLYIE